MLASPAPGRAATAAPGSRAPHAACTRLTGRWWRGTTSATPVARGHAARRVHRSVIAWNLRRRQLRLRADRGGQSSREEL
ncbi:hypothetical protein GCM10020358_00430 [Amorphoplanes nipponensis]